MRKEGVLTKDLLDAPAAISGMANEEGADREGTSAPFTDLESMLQFYRHIAETHEGSNGGDESAAGNTGNGAGEE